MIYTSYGNDYPLSDEQIVELCKPLQVKIITYNQLKNYDSIEQLFAHCKNIALLFRYQPNYGHWVSLLYYPPNLIEVFDSLGQMIDNELMADDSTNKMLGQNDPTLSKLLFNWLNENKNHKIWYNEIPFQHKNTETCGRWTAYRIKK